MSKARTIFFALLLALPALFWQLGSRALSEPDEGRCASVAREMFTSGDWMVPRLYGVTHANKPPLLYWLLDVAYRFGGVNEWTTRAVPALAALGIVLLVIALGRRLDESARGLTSGLVLLTSPLFFAMARICDYNMLLSLWVTLAFWAVVAWRQDGEPWQRRMVYVACTLAMLTKGPVGPAILALGVLGEWLLRPRGQAVRPVWHGPSFLIALLASLSWFVAVASEHPGLWTFFLRGEFYNRVFTMEHQRGEPFLFYFFVLPAGVLPWLPAVLASLVRAIRTRRESPAARLALGWIALPLVMFTLSKSKMPTYVLPLVPALALMVGQAAPDLERHRGFRRLQALWITLLIIALPTVLALHGPSWANWSNPFKPIDGVCMAVAAMFALATLRKPGALRVPGLAAGLAILYLVLHALLVREDRSLGPHTSVKYAAQAVLQEPQQPDRVVLLGRYPRGLSFYLRSAIYMHSAKFPPQIPEDEERLGEYIYNDALQVYPWFDSEERVVVFVSPRSLVDMRDHVHKKIRQIHDDGQYIVVANY